MKSLLKENLKRNRSNGSDDSYAKKMGDAGSCMLLDEDRFCEIQKELGPEYLSNTCAFYLRKLNVVDEVIEKLATLPSP